MIWNFCIRRPVLTIVMFVVMGIFGVYGYLQMPVQENPDVDFPIVSVSVELPGASPDVVDSEIIEPLEAEINTIEGLRQLTSTARQQVGQIIAEFELWRDIDVAVQEVRDAVDRAGRRLPSDAETPIVRKLDLGAQAIMWVAMTGDERWTDVRMTDYVENTIKQQLETLRGVGQIQVGGTREYAVRIRLDPERLAAHQVTVQEVIQTIQRENVDIPSGRVEGATREFLVQTRGRFDSAEPFNSLIIAYRNDSPVRLHDVGEAVEDVASDRQLARFAGEMTVGMGIVKTADANTIEVARAVREAMERISQGFPPGLQYTIAVDSSEYVQESIRDLLVTILMATGLVMLVVLGFLRSGRGTIVTIVAIPTSLLISLAVMNLLGFSINVVSMLALVLVIGIVIDDAIIVLERTYLHMEGGAESEPAARVGTTEVAFPNIANSLALGAVFLPVAFTGGLIGRFLMEFGVTVAVTVFASTFVALTLTPMLCSRVLRVPESHGRLFRISEKLFTVVDNHYKWLLKMAFRFRGFTVFVGLAAFGIGALAFMDLSHEFAADEDRSQFLIIMETPRGSTISQTDAFARQIEAELASMDEIQHQFLAIGAGMGGPGTPSRAFAFVRLTPRDARDRHQFEIMHDLRQRLNALPGGRAFVSELVPGGVGGSPVEVVLQNPDLDTLASWQDEIMAWIEDQPDWYTGVRTNLEMNMPELDVLIDRDRASQMGVSVADISNTLRFFLGNIPISEIEIGTERYDVIPDIIGRGNLEPEILANLYVRGTGGELVSLDNLVESVETIGPSEIHRFNRMRAATISADTPPGVPLGDAVNRLEAHLGETLPAEVRYEMAGLSQIFEESFRYLTIAIGLSVIFIFLILAAQFESFIYPLTIMMALPLATVGAFGGLWLAGQTFNIYAFLGLIMLLGLVAKNSILLVDYTNVLVGRGLPPMEAAQEAAKARFRPVLMTALSTILGMTPIVLGYGAGGEARMPLGITVAAGLFAATFLTLVVIPVVYTLADQLQGAVVRLLQPQARKSHSSASAKTASS